MWRLATVGGSTTSTRPDRPYGALAGGWRPLRLLLPRAVVLVPRYNVCVCVWGGVYSRASPWLVHARRAFAGAWKFVQASTAFTAEADTAKQLLASSDVVRVVGGCATAIELCQVPVACRSRATSGVGTGRR